MSQTPAKQRSAGAKRRASMQRNWKPEFLQALEDTGTVVQACRVAGISRRGAYDARQSDEAFALAWADVDAKVTDTLERVAVHRAINGSDRLLEFLLKARRPDLYRENTVRVEHSGSVKHDLTSKTDAELDDLEARLSR